VIALSPDRYAAAVAYSARGVSVVAMDVIRRFIQAKLERKGLPLPPAPTPIPILGNMRSVDPSFCRDARAVSFVFGRFHAYLIDDLCLGIV
jgi:hypothetical protein